MAGESADPFGDLAAWEQGDHRGSISAHVAEVISKLAGSLESLGASQDMDVQITYEIDLAVSSCDCAP